MLQPMRFVFIFFRSGVSCEPDLRLTLVRVGPLAVNGLGDMSTDRLLRFL